MRMLAAVPTAHQPCGANGVQLCPPRDGSATVIATASTDASRSWKAAATRSPSTFATRTAPNIARPTIVATSVPDP
jgi:hypothetical protein